MTEDIDEALVNQSKGPPSPKKVHFDKPYGMITLMFFFLNMFMSTSPYSFLYAMKEGGLILGLSFFIFSSFIAFCSAQMIVESVGIACAKSFDPGESPKFYHHKSDKEVEKSPYYIKKKYELFGLSKVHTNTVITICTSLAVCSLLFGSMMAVTISSVDSLTSALSYILYSDPDQLEELYPSTYYIAMGIFAIIATIFSCRNLEDSRGLQMTLMALRFVFVYLMIRMSLFSIIYYGPADLSKVKMFDFTNMRILIGNILYALYHHTSLSGMVFPLRPQVKYEKSLITSYLLQGGLMFVHCLLGVLAFGDKENHCYIFPCSINEIFNINFLAFPILGLVVQFFPVLGLAVFATVSITLRNNIMQILGRVNLTAQASLKSRFIWTLIITSPAYLICALKVDIQEVISLSGGFSALYVLLILPPLLAIYSRPFYDTEKGKEYGENFYRPIIYWSKMPHFILVCGSCFVVFQIYDIVNKFVAPS